MVYAVVSRVRGMILFLFFIYYRVRAGKMRINWKVPAILMIACSVVSGSMVSLKFVQDFMKLYRLKDPMFVMQLGDLDYFLLELRQTPFEAICCLCYGESMPALNIVKSIMQFHVIINFR